MKGGENAMNPDGILKTLFRILPNDCKEIESVFLYGNKQGRDVDLFVIFGGKLANAPLGRHIHDSLDVGFVGTNFVQTMITHFDPIILEPILTGQTIFGNHIDYREIVLRQVIDSNTPRYLLGCANTFFEWAIGSADKGLFKESIFNLSFTQSYISYALHYWKGGGLVLFKELLVCKEGFLIKRLREKAKSDETISETELCRFFNEVRRSLTEIKNLLTYI